MEPAGSLPPNIGIEEELICSAGVSIASAKRKSPQAALRTGSFVPFTMKRGSSTDSAHAPKIELTR
jgi:hypothetical protein